MTRRRSIRRVVHAGMLVWAVAFFVFISPGHTRGYIEYQVASLVRPAQAGAVAGDPACEPGGACFVAGRSCCRGGAPAGDGPRRPPMPKRCAICEIIAKLDVPQPWIIYEHFFASLGVIAPRRGESLFDYRAPQPFAGRAPPACA